jgi:CheY-like chemotaxis protein
LMRAVDAGPVDLITLDLRLGNEDGLGIARHLRARRNVPIVMITGRVATTSAGRCEDTTGRHLTVPSTGMSRDCGARSNRWEVRLRCSSGQYAGWAMSLRRSLRS